MNRRTRPRLMRTCAAFMTIALVIGACSSVTVDSERDRESQHRASENPAVPEQGSSANQAGKLEEIVVSGSAPGEAAGQASRDDDQAAADTPDSLEARAKRLGGKMRSPTAYEMAPSSIMARSNMPMLQGGMNLVDYAGGPPLASLASDEELWVIAKPAAGAVASSQTQYSDPGTGSMILRFPEEPDETTGQPKEVPLPLKHTEVKAVINGYISTVNVTQKFENPFNEKIEAIYMFPLPEKAAVNEFLMIIGERRIRGILREKEEAEEIYREARSRGYQASLLVQHRPNVFEQKVANIEPGHAIDVDIKYFHTLAYNDGWYSFVFPTVVGPRFNPAGSEDPIEALPRSSTQQTGGVGVHYLRPDERSGHDINISVEINAGVAIENVNSSHSIEATRRSPETTTVTLANESAIPNKDFILDFQVAGSTVKSSLLTYVDPEDQQGYFTLMLYPPANYQSLARQPMELVFVLDCSGSMNGRPLEQAKSAVLAALDHLNDEDTFQIIRFSDDASQFGPDPVPATKKNIQQARDYLKRLHGTGGTRMIEGVKAALDFAHDPARLRFVSFMTDGFIGNESDIIAAVHDNIGDSRIFSFGVGSSVNRYLMERMAKEGKGAVAYLAPNDSATNIMNGFFERISHPALTDVEIDWGSMSVSDVYPARLPDLFVGRSVVVTGKYLGAAGDIAVAGVVGGERQRIAIDGVGRGPENAYVPKIWARLRIAELVDRQTWQEDPQQELEAAIRNTALRYQLMSDYTSFVAVDTSRQTEGEFGTTIHQAVPVPDGVRYETTVRDR